VFRVEQGTFNTKNTKTSAEHGVENIDTVILIFVD
jgi:hypothetical protein